MWFGRAVFFAIEVDLGAPHALSWLEHGWLARDVTIGAVAEGHSRYLLQARSWGFRLGHVVVAHFVTVENLECALTFSRLKILPLLACWTGELPHRCLSRRVTSHWSVFLDCLRVYILQLLDFFFALLSFLDSLLPFEFLFFLIKEGDFEFGNPITVHFRSKPIQSQNHSLKLKIARAFNVCNFGIW